jgi:hydrophobe/amphiphile efflux-1 (HAE1) family protein
MGLGNFFIQRPVFSMVCSIFVTVLGILSAFRLAVEPYPDVAPPTVNIRAVYPGADAATISETVSVPLEQEINGIENMLYITSRATQDGVLSIDVVFELGSDINTAQVLTLNRVNSALPRLPQVVRDLGVTVTKRSPDLTLVIHLLSPDNSRDDLFVSNYALLNVRDALARLPGVGDVRVFGSGDYALRVWIDPLKAAARSISAREIVAAIREQNTQAVSGIIGGPPSETESFVQIPIVGEGRLKTTEEFEQIVLKTNNDGSLTYLKDIANVEIAAQDYSLKSLLGGKTATAIPIFQLPGSNALETADTVIAKVEELSKSFPSGLDYQVVYNPTEFISSSIREVVFTLFAATALVVLVIVVFLRTWRASIIPLATIPISLIGTFAIMGLFDFSINNLTLFGLILAIGIVVDDAIVVVENVERHLAEGMTSKEAAKKSMEEVTGAIIATSLVLLAVFVPTVLLGGVEGRFYQQFALTIAGATIVSTFCALSLSPSLSGLLLRAKSQNTDSFSVFLEKLFGTFFDRFERFLAAVAARYERVLDVVLSRTKTALLGFVALLFGGLLLFLVTPTGFVPVQDQGYLVIYCQLPPGSTLSRTTEVVSQISKLARSVPEVRDTVEFPGLDITSFLNQSNTATTFVPLIDFKKRDRRASEIAETLQQKLSTITQAFVAVFEPPAVRGLGSVGGFRLFIQDRSGQGSEALLGQAMQAMGAANQSPNLNRVFTTFRTDYPQFKMELDREKIFKLDIDYSEVLSTLQTYVGQSYVNDLNLFGRTYQVRAQAQSPFRDSLSDLESLKVKSRNNQMVALGSLVSFEAQSGPASITRYNLFPAADLSGSAAPGMGSGAALSEIKGILGNVLSPAFGFEFTELSFFQERTGNTAPLIFALSIFFVFLVLAAQYESWVLPLSIVLIVPTCVVAALAGVRLFGLEADLFVQIGLIVLVALASKNAILIVEFAKQKENEGLPLGDALRVACSLRLRPILMTSFSFIFGVMPLIFSSGAGAEMRRSLGITMFSGMLGVTIFGLMLTPVFYFVLRNKQDKSGQTKLESS